MRTRVDFRKFHGNRTAIPLKFAEINPRSHTFSLRSRLIKQALKPVDDIPAFRNLWGLSDSVRFTYRNLKTDRQTPFCFDPNNPTSIDLDIGGECEIIENDQLKRIPVYSSIAAGAPITMNPETDQDIFLPKEWMRGGEHFILKVRGDSMTGAKIYNDDLVVVRAQQAADNLDIVVVALGDEGTLKRFTKMGSNAILLAENPKYDPIMLNDDQVHIMGVAVGIIRPRRE